MLRPAVAVALVVLSGCNLLKKEAAQCPGRYGELPKELREAGGACACPLGVGGGPVWGGGVYTQDSSICRAAVHAGAVDPARGGTVTFKPAPGCSKYTASTKHEVTTTKWKSYPASFYFPGFGEPACPSGVPNECPDTYQEIPGVHAVTTFSCNCDSGAAGSVWGSGPYTRDSVICAAAIHAGAATKAGGKVTVRPAPPCLSYAGTEKNGVKSADWGKFEQGSFFFEDFGGNACAPIPSDLCPDTFHAIEGSEGVQSFSCGCVEPVGGAVWGSGMYTRDSSLCAAAKHAGALKADGKITVRAAKACGRYVGSEKNGVSTGDWGAYEGGSFTFGDEAACPVQ